MDISSNAGLSFVPVHVGIILDGNGRWAKQRGLVRTEGHTEGLKRAKEIARTASDLGIKYLTLYFFSTENWKRAQSEVGFLMNLIHSHLVQEFDFYRENKIRVRHLGDLSGLTKQIRNDIIECENDTAAFTGLTINIAINYGGRDEIVRGVRKLVSEGVAPENISEESLGTYFDNPELPDADLIIRTGGEKRLSNFLLWYSSYAELIFSPLLWPDYTKDEFVKDLEEFGRRNRRFGAVPV